MAGRDSLNKPTVFLDFDGVLHPDEVYLVRNQPVLRMDGFSLFEWSGILAESLDPYPAVQLVLSTSWVRLLGFEEAREHLPEPLRQRVTGATWHATVPRRWTQMTRYEQVLHYIERHRTTRWLAIDDDGAGWAEKHLPNLVLTDSLLGLGVALAQADLRDKLQRFLNFT